MMNTLTDFKSDVEPTPTGHSHIGKTRLLIGLFGAPLAWVVQLSVSEPLSAHACYPYRAPLPTPLWQDLTIMLAIICAVCFITALLSGLTALTSWRLMVKTLAGNNTHAIGRKEGRTRFLVKLSLMTSFIFIVAVIFNGFAVLLVLPCSPWL